MSKWSTVHADFPSLQSQFHPPQTALDPLTKARNQYVNSQGKTIIIRIHLSHMSKDNWPNVTLYRGNSTKRKGNLPIDAQGIKCL